ncbi:MAG: TIGR02186 family protein [Rhodospirillales bacterium]
MIRGAIMGLLALVLTVQPARSEVLLADVAEHLVAITTGFDGAKVLIFGAMREPTDLVITIRGPARPAVVHRKGSVAGVWINTATMTFPRAPSYYSYASSAPLTEIVDEVERQRLGLGLGALDLQPSGRASPNLLREWREGLIRAKQRSGLYVGEAHSILLLGGRLFRTAVQLPANVPTGTFLIDVYLFQDGLNVAAQTIPLVVRKVGLEADIFSLAHQNSALYGLMSIFIALLAGWVAHLLFRRR